MNYTFSPETSKKVIEWFLGDNVGLSSKAICAFMLGIPQNHYPSPLDKSDRWRCIQLLNEIPEWWDRLIEMNELPSEKVNVFTLNGIKVEERGWKEQIPLIFEEANKDNQ